VNWSGYAAVSPATEAAPSTDSPLTFSDVTGSWIPPEARCVKSRADAAAFWVGISGFDEGSSTFQQLGTAAQCSGRGIATYFVWWEIVPAGEVRVPMKVGAGHRVPAAVLINGSKVTMSIKNATSRTRFSTTVTVAQPLDVSSAEWIAEAPTACTPSGVCEVVQLPTSGASRSASQPQPQTACQRGSPPRLARDSAAADPGCSGGRLRCRSRRALVRQALLQGLVAASGVADVQRQNRQLAARSVARSCK
jgi:hypothetical protein